MSSTHFITITPLRIADIPPEEALVAEATELLASSASWKVGKTFFDVVETSGRSKRPEDGALWHCRHSQHAPAEISFDNLWDKLAVNKAANERDFIHELKKVTKLKDISPTASLWSLYYTFTPPVSARVFTELQVIHLSSTSPRTGTIISIPINLAGHDDLIKLQEKGVLARYASVERVMELPNGNLEWRLLVSSNTGGSIPSFITEHFLPKKISQDVPSFFKWYNALSR